MKKLYFAFGAAALALASTAAAQVSLPQVWKVNQGDLTWFGNDSTARGAFYLPTSNTLAIIDRSPVDCIRYLNVSNGTEVLNGASAAITTGTGVFSAGAVIINKGGVSTDGVLYAANINTANNAASLFKVYRWTDYTSAPTVAVNYIPNGPRWGDDLLVRGSGNNTQIISMANNGAAPFWNQILALTTTDGGLSFTTNTLNITGAPFQYVGTPNLSFDPDSTTTIWWRKSATTNTENTSAVQYSLNIAGLTASFVSGTTATIGAGPIAVFKKGGTNYIASGPSVFTGTNATGALTNATTGNTDFIFNALEKTGGAANANGNGSGQVVAVPSLDRIFFLYTNNSISAFGLTASAAARDWNLY